jgi:hypothetical protein
VNGQPPITAGAGLASTDWLPGPCADSGGPVIVSFTDFRTRSEEDLHAVFETGLSLSESWPIMHGAVGLWLWGKPGEFRGGAVSVWASREDLRRFTRWPVHLEIVKRWSRRMEVLTETWSDEQFDPHRAWSRAEEKMRASRDMAPAASGTGEPGS